MKQYNSVSIVVQYQMWTIYEDISGNVEMFNVMIFNERK